MIYSKLLEKFQGNFGKMPSLNDHTALVTLKCGLWHESRFQEDLTLTAPSTIQDALY